MTQKLCILKCFDNTQNDHTQMMIIDDNFYKFSDEPTGRLALVFELMDMNLYENIKGMKQ